MKFLRQYIPRGIKLPVQGVFNLIRNIQTAVNSVGLDAQNIAQNNAPWTAHYNIPLLDSQFFSYPLTNAGRNHPVPELCFPLMLLPPQEQYSETMIANGATVQFLLQAVTLSFDQRGEAAGLNDPYSLEFTGVNNSFTYCGNAREQLVSRYNVDVRISEQVPSSYAAHTFASLATRDIFNGNFTVEGAADPTGGSNPTTWENLNKSLDPYKVYWVRINAQSLFPADDNTLWAGLTSLNITLRGTSTLMDRDRGIHVQNITSAGLDYPTPDNLEIGYPSGGQTITANDGYGVNSAFSVLDRRLSDKLWSGVLKDGSLPAVEHYLQDAGYVVIPVPLWQNYGVRNRLMAANADLLPIGALSGAWATDWRRIRLEFPMVIHHVLGFFNFSSPPRTSSVVGYPASLIQDEPGMKPNSLFQTPQALTYQIDVGIGTGLRADSIAFETIAHGEYNMGFGTIVNSQTSNGAINYFKQAFNGILTQRGDAYDWDIGCIPVPIVGTGGSGPQPQGTPFYTGLATTPYQPRTDVSIGRDPHPPKTAGLEQWIEVRMGISSDNGLGGPTLGGAAQSDLVCYAGTGGHWVLILGKKLPQNATLAMEI